MSGGEEGKEMRVRTMEISGVSGASALKMCYRGISKAIAGLGGYAAQAHSPGTAKAFFDALTESQPGLTERLSRTIPDMIPKAYRRVGEMDEISSFISSSTTKSAPTTYPNPADMYQGLAQMFQRVADDVKSSQAGEDREEIRFYWTGQRRGGRARKEVVKTRE
ncbi:hypothetical protein I310_02050 [Cryptococcus deuterogattii CA1014]|nr:hypothetical protein I352_03763 [Cryptococcus deuterogattii MMRL2647]KIR74443.1 hypothetical protein I310_02050 [Cryptococcus deuterogattii CA1014]